MQPSGKLRLICSVAREDLCNFLALTAELGVEHVYIASALTASRDTDRASHFHLIMTIKVSEQEGIAVAMIQRLLSTRHRLEEKN